MIRFSEANSLHACRVSATSRSSARAGHAGAVAATIIGSVLLVSVASSAHAQLVTPTLDTADMVSSCTCRTSATACGYSLQATASSRITVVSGGRDGNTALRLDTESGDSNVFGSGANERTDVALTLGWTLGL